MGSGATHCSKGKRHGKLNSFIRVNLSLVNRSKLWNRKLLLLHATSKITGYSYISYFQKRRRRKDDFILTFGRFIFFDNRVLLNTWFYAEVTLHTNQLGSLRKTFPSIVSGMTD